MLNTSKNNKLFSPRILRGIKPVFLIFFFSFSVTAQENLVPNGDFEEYNWCPNSTNGYFINACSEWLLPTMGTADYFNKCSTELGPDNYPAYSVPVNYVGYQEAHSGNGYAGYYAALSTDNNNYYEYLSVKLKRPLAAGQIYHLSYFVSLADSIYDASNGLPQPSVNYSAAYFSELLPILNTDLKIIANPQVRSEEQVFINDTIGWQEIEGYFIAEGGEEYLTIGFFCNLSELDYNMLYGTEIPLGVNPYHYIDDVVLEESELLVPNCFSPNEDGKNDSFSLNLTDLPLNTEVTILNRWGNIVFNSKNENSSTWDGLNNGEKCTEGLYFYIIRIGEIEKTGFIHLIR